MKWTVERLLWGLVGRFEYERVGRKPLGDGFDAVRVREFRGRLLRPFPKAGVRRGVNVLVASGYGGQTLDTLALAGGSGGVRAGHRISLCSHK